MRLWPLAILPQLPRQHLLGQHRECCALRGKGWGRKHATVDYVFKHPYYWLYLYHRQVMFEMMNRQMRPDEKWFLSEYRGKTIGIDNSDFTKSASVLVIHDDDSSAIYSEHDQRYLKECIENLSKKGITIKIHKECAA